MKLPGGQTRRHVLFRIEPGKMPADNLVRGVLLDALGPAVPGDDAPLRVEQDESVVLDPVDHDAETLFTRLEVAHLCLELGVGAAQVRFRLGACGDFALQFLRAAHGERLGNDRDQGNDRRPGDDRGQELDEPGETIRRPPEDERLHQVRRAAGEDEQDEKDENTPKRDVAAPHDKGGQHARNGDVSRPDAEVGQDVEPAVGVGPVAAVPARGETGGVEKPRKEFEHDGTIYQTNSAIGRPPSIT
ncbi:MAG: hypothetical protein U0793_18255 [Gemmataceae bacterium]